MADSTFALMSIVCNYLFIDLLKRKKKESVNVKMTILGKVVEWLRVHGKCWMYQMTHSADDEVACCNKKSCPPTGARIPKTEVTPTSRPAFETAVKDVMELGPTPKPTFTGRVEE